MSSEGVVEGVVEFASHNHMFYTFSMGEIEIKDEPPSQRIVGNAEEEFSAVIAGTANRDFSEYLHILGISKKDLGKDVLDLGSGEIEKFSRQASKLGITVVSLSPRLTFNGPSIKAARMEIEGLPPHQGRSVAALATHLPFKANSFDSVVSVYAIPYYLPEELYEKAFSEMTRVLKPSGKAFLAPIDIYSKEHGDYLKSILDKIPNIHYLIKSKPAAPWANSFRRTSKRLTLTKK